jgi:hypothetical protein
MTEDQFIDRFQPIMCGDGYTMKEFGWNTEEEKVVIHKAIKERRCWTVVAGDDGLYISHGNRVVNRLHNIITRNPLPIGVDWVEDVKLD